MSMLRLEPVIFLQTPLGLAEAHFKQTFESHETHSVWHTFQCETKEPWEWPNPLVRLCDSVTALRDGAMSDIQVSDDYFETLLAAILRHPHSPFYDRAVISKSEKIAGEVIRQGSPVTTF